MLITPFLKRFVDAKYEPVDHCDLGLDTPRISMHDIIYTLTLITPTVS